MNVSMKLMTGLVFIALIGVMPLAAQGTPTPITLDTARDVVELTQIQFDFSSAITDMTLSPDGYQLAIIAGETVQLVDVTHISAPPSSLEIGQLTPHAIAYSPDGSVLVVGGMERERYTHRLDVWDVVSGQRLFTMDGHSDVIGSVVYSPDGAWIASGSRDGTVRLWDAHTDENLAVLSGHTGAVTDVAFLPDGTLASVSDDGILMVWDDIAHGTGRPIVLPDHTLYQIEPSPDATTWTIGGYDFERGRGLLFVVDAETSELLIEYDMGTRAVTAFAYSPDGAVLATGQIFEQIHLWDLSAEESLASFGEGAGEPARLIFHPDGAVLFSADFLGTVVSVWGVANGGGLPVGGGGPNAEKATPIPTLVGSPNDPPGDNAITVEPSGGCMVTVSRIAFMFPEPDRMATGADTPPEPVHAGDSIALTGQLLGGDGQMWYQTDNGEWVIGFELFSMDAPPLDCAALPHVVPAKNP